MAPIPPVRQLYINGEWCAPESGGRYPIINPASEEEIGTIPAAQKEDVDKAVAAAKAAFYRDNGTVWPKTSGAHRAKYLLAIAEKVKEKKQFLAELEALDMGKPLDEALWDIDDVAGCFEYYAELAIQLDGKQNTPIEIPMDTFQSCLRKEALGVVGLITPWNYPLLIASWKVAPALAAGCTVVLKPSELASMTCLELGDICHEIGLPAGVLNIITGTGIDSGAPLSSHPDIDKVSFTGSSFTGKAVMRSAAENLKPVTLELGGKSPAIVFDDVDIDNAVEWVMFGCFWTNGQICSATSRLLIQESIVPKFLAKLAEWAPTIPFGDPFKPGCRLGPVVSKGQYTKILGFIEEAQSEGAVLVTGGRHPPSLPKGYFIEPTVLKVTRDMKVWQEEVFGPVLSVLTFKEEADAVALANNSK